jgi:YgiT-type zinc finger domain-containing protein
MSCAIRRNGITRSGTVTVTLQRGDTTVILKPVPADVCENCGEYYLSSEVTAQVLEKAEWLYAINGGSRLSDLTNTLS